MLRNIFLVLLLIYAVNAAQLESSEVDSAEDQDEEISAEGLLEQQSFIKCTLCKAIMTAVKTLLSSKPRVDEIKAKLHKVCDFLMDKIVKELMTDDAPKAICTKINFCD